MFKKGVILTLFLIFGDLDASTIRLNFIKIIEYNFSHPTDIVGDGSGKIYVLDGVNNRIVQISLNDGPKEIVIKDDSIKLAVGIDYNDGIWVADTPRNRLVKINGVAQIETEIMLDKSARPLDISFINNSIYFSDRHSHNIGVVDIKSLSIEYIGSKGDELGEFTFPGPLFKFNESVLLISDIYNGRVIGMKNDHRLFFKIASFGTDLGYVYRPKGISVDSKNRIWVADGFTGVIQAFSHDVTFLGVGVENAKKIQLNTPTGIWIDQDDYLWVVESMVNRVSIWQIK